MNNSVSNSDERVASLKEETFEKCTQDLHYLSWSLCIKATESMTNRHFLKKVTHKPPRSHIKCLWKQGRPLLRERIRRTGMPSPTSRGVTGQHLAHRQERLAITPVSAAKASDKTQQRGAPSTRSTLPASMTLRGETPNASERITARSKRSQGLQRGTENDSHFETSTSSL